VARRSAGLFTTHPLALYYALTFLISWAGMLVIAGRRLAPANAEEHSAVLAIAIATMLAGPLVGGLLMTAVVAGRSGLRELFERMLMWRVSVRWYFLALFTAPVVMLTVQCGLALVSPVFWPGVLGAQEPSSRIWFALAAGAVVGVNEEVGWTGFVTPRLRRHYSILRTGLIVGALWGLWHVAATVLFASRVYAGSLPFWVYVVARVASLLLGALPAYRVLMTWTYEQSRSLVIAVLMHASLTASTLAFEPVGISGPALVVSDLVFGGAWWIVVGVITANGGSLTRAPQPEREVPA
jgi:membrane protease YdiL (CAAX protease family)